MIQPSKLAAVIGWPIAQSKSPAIHGYWLKKHGIDGFYLPIAMPPAGFRSGVRKMIELGFSGANVTIPHKEAALAMAQEATARAREIGAANTLVFRADGSILADNTDGEGFLNNLLQYQPDWSAAAGPALVLGAGGAARAVIHALLQSGAPRVMLANRTRSRARNLRDHFGIRVKVVDWDDLPVVIPDAKTLVNTTSLGMTGQPPLNVSLRGLPVNALVTDLVYNPLMTDLLVAAQQRGNPVVDGLGMLLHQAVPGFEAWFGVRPVVDDALRELVLAQK
jgi:shikimate dehydrogenase